MLSNILDKVSFWSIFLMIVLLPIFTVPFTSIPIETSKTFVVVLGLTLAIISWAISCFSEGKIVFPKSKIFLSVLGILLVYLASSFLSDNSSTSFFGIVLDVGTFWYISSAVFALFIASIVVDNQAKNKLVLKGLISSFFIVFILQIVNLFVSIPFLKNILSDKTSNLIGSWNSLGIFAGLAIIISIFIIEFYKPSKKKKIILSVLLFLALFLILSVNFYLIWLMLGIFSLFIFILKLLNNSVSSKDSHTKDFPTFSLVIVIISLFFLMFTRFLGGALPNALGIVNVEVNPSVETTLGITKDVIKSNPVLGSGPNTFNESWSLHKPLIINQSQFWNTSFVSGFGLIPTFMATTGILGIIIWLVFILLFIFSNVRTIFVFLKNKYSLEYFLYFFASTYLLVSALLYPVSSSLFILAFIFIGISIGMISNKLDKKITINFLQDPRKVFFVILTLVVILLSTLGLAFKYFEKFASVFYFSKTLNATEVPVAENNIARAIVLNENDLYYRIGSQIYLSKINILISEENVSDENKAVIQDSINQSILLAGEAVRLNPNNYLNHEFLGFAYKNALLLGIEDAYEKALESYQKASSLNPKNPLLKLEIARLFFSKQNINEARANATASLELKSDFVQALFFLAQLEESLGKNREALSYAENALTFLPNDQELADYVNSLRNKTTAPNPSTE